MAKKITYLSRNYDDYKNALVEFSKTYYPELATSFNDASVGSWFIDLNAIIADELSYHIDRAYQETQIDSANSKASVYSIARNSGFKVPGPKGAMAEVKFTCNLPLGADSGVNREPDWNYAPRIKRGTKVCSASQVFEVREDIDFSEQFNSDGVSDRTFAPIRNSNGLIVGYQVSKLSVVIAGETKIYKKTISSTDITPFMEILIPTDGVMNVESVIMKQGSSFQSNPTMGEFYMAEETLPLKYPTTTRFFEVDTLIQQERWGDVTETDGTPVVYKYTYGSDNTPAFSITKGEWKPVRHKFMTEFTDKGYLKLIFGAGLDVTDTVDFSSASDFSKYQITKTLLNDSLGLLPEQNTTIFILYRVGGGKASNVAKGSINTISYLNAEIPKITSTSNSDVASKVAYVKNSLKVTNTTPSVSGKDVPTVDELRYMIKYNNAERGRCVTVKDYVSRVLMMPSKNGTPFRVSGTEANNKIMLYALGVNTNGYLEDVLPVALVNNIKNYLLNYRTINDFVEIKSGRIINLSIEADLFVDKDSDKSEVVTSIINAIKSYFDINKHQMGDDIFVGDLQKEISNINGVLNLIDLRVYNEFGEGYSSTQTSQETETNDSCSDSGEEYVEGRLKIDLGASDSVLISDGDCMFEIKYPEKDIRLRIKER